LGVISERRKRSPMSEFSEGYHLRATAHEAAVDLLRRAQLPGFVFPASNGWVSVFPQGMPFQPNERFLAANDGTLLYFFHAGDHGWGFTLYVGPNAVAHYLCSWDPELHVDRPLDLVAFESVLGPMLTSLGQEVVESALEPKSIEQALSHPPPTIFANAIGLAHFEWLSYEYLSSDRERGDPLPPGVMHIEVS